jgi:hypothetical protein
MSTTNAPRKDTRSQSGPKGQNVPKPPVEVLPIVHREVSVEKLNNHVGYYHFLDTKPSYARKKMHDENGDKLYAIVACSDVQTKDLPPRFDPRDHLKSWNCPVLSTWISKNGKTVLIPAELPDFHELSESEIVKLIYPKVDWNEHVIVVASMKKGKFFYKNPCDRNKFLQSVAKLNSYKKFSESEAEHNKKYSTESAKILIPAHHRSKVLIPEGKKRIYIIFFYDRDELLNYHRKNTCSSSLLQVFTLKSGRFWFLKSKLIKLFIRFCFISWLYSSLFFR